MSAPFLSTPKSGYGGRGYHAIFEPEKVTVPSVTTVLGALDKPGITQWAVDQTAAYAAANPEYLLNRSVEQAFAGLRWYHKRTPDWDDPETDIYNYHTGVLNDLAELGTNIHEWAEAHFNGGFEPELTRQENVQMAEQLILWEMDNDVEVLHTEATVFGNGYAGTLDLIARVNGKLELIDLKGLPLDTRLPTPQGWTTMADVQVGDTLFGSDGKPCIVTAKSEVHHNPCYEVKFNTGEVVVADKDHRWKVEVGRWGNTQTLVMTTEEVRLHLESRVGKQRNLRILNASALELPEADLPIDPYVLGVWLGDGTATKNEITINSTDKQGIVAELESRGWGVTVVEYPSDKSNQSMRIRLGDAGHFGDSEGGAKSSEFKALLQKLGVVGDKHIPTEYLRASYAQRLDLLRGLMDTDGTVAQLRNNEPSISTTDQKFAVQISELVSSLGWRTYNYSNPVSWTYGGEKKWTTAWTVKFRPHDGVNPFLARPKDVPSTVVAGHRMVNSVTPVETVPTQCIEVESSDHTYLFGDAMMVTHNTSRAIRDEHMGQLGALGAAHTMAVEVPAGTEGAVSHTIQVECAEGDEGAKKKVRTVKGQKVHYFAKDLTKWFVAEPLPPIQGYGVLQLRPDDVDNKGNFLPAFCELHEIPNDVIEPAFELFRGALAVRVAQKNLREVKKGWLDETEYAE